jgi:hypothetical protein
MGMREHDRAGMQPLKFSQPIEAAIDHHIGVTMRDHQRCVHPMPPRPFLDLAPSPEECELHSERLTLFTASNAIYL